MKYQQKCHLIVYVMIRMGPRLLGGLKCGKHISIGLSIQLKLLQLLTELPLAQRQFNIGKVFMSA